MRACITVGALAQAADNFRSCFVALARGVDLQYWLVEHALFDYGKPFIADIPAVIRVLESVGVLQTAKP